MSESQQKPTFCRKAKAMIDVLIRTSGVGDKIRFKPKGSSVSNLTEHHPNGVSLSGSLPSDMLGETLVPSCW